MARLDIGTGAKLYLGLVHFNDEEGPRRRNRAAQIVVKDFGVATECGIGRTPADQLLPNILQISRDVTIGGNDCE